MGSEALQPSEDAHRFDIEIRPLAPPLRQDSVDVILLLFTHAASIAGDILTSR
ncbi:hypothetical protein RHECNPAF_2530031 [Rhizobium etli CNPAF512]|nr:hypothetical protein RHECNPAF_2530031 [Rhizobium etli CNPAF512]